MPFYASPWAIGLTGVCAPNMLVFLIDIYFHTFHMHHSFHWRYTIHTLSSHHTGDPIHTMYIVYVLTTLQIRSARSEALDWQDVIDDSLDVSAEGSLQTHNSM